MNQSIPAILGYSHSSSIRINLTKKTTATAAAAVSVKRKTSTRLTTNVSNSINFVFCSIKWYNLCFARDSRFATRHLRFKLLSMLTLVSRSLVLLRRLYRVQALRAMSRFIFNFYFYFSFFCFLSLNSFSVPHGKT